MLMFSSAVWLFTLFLAPLSHTEARRRCPRACTKEYFPVCGSNEVTYDNICLLNYQSCVTYGLVKFKHFGLCKNCTMSCPNSWERVCASDGLYYRSECHVRANACFKGITLTVERFDSCRVSGHD